MTGCQIPGAGLDRAIGALLVESVTPEAVALTLAIQEEVVHQADEARRLRHLQVERAQYEADLAQRRYLKVDPDNRLVASVLEAEWNTKLRALEEARAIEERANQNDQHRVSAQERVEIEATPERFRQFWNDLHTTARERKRAARLVIEDVTVHKAEQIVAHVRFKGGATQTITVPLPPPFAQSRFTSPETLAAIDRLLDTYTDARGAPSSSTTRAIVPLRACFSRVCMSPNCAEIMDSPIAIPVYGPEACLRRRKPRMLTASLLKRFGTGIARDALLGCATVTEDRVCSLLSKRVSNGLLMCFDHDSSNEVQYAT